MYLILRFMHLLDLNLGHGFCTHVYCQMIESRALRFNIKLQFGAYKVLLITGFEGICIS
uniref:Uncharacterized protein n=1 Tax=Arundo donax TaxID=35708 RepID=A0A0A9D1P6_ARUDO